MSEQVKQGSGGWARMRWVTAGLMGGLLAGGASGWAVGRADEGGGRGFLGHHRHFMHGRGPVDPAQAREHVQVGVRWALKYVDATAEQEQQIQGIALSALDDLLPLRTQHRANRDVFHAALESATIDRAALEQARVSELKLADQASQRLLKALADAADALTPEQRAQLAAAAHRFR
jgi:periplasmic protein CpxP/Spy